MPVLRDPFAEADWEHPGDNDFLLVSHFSVPGTLYTCRPDLVAFVAALSS